MIPNSTAGGMTSVLWKDYIQYWGGYHSPGVYPKSLWYPSHSTDGIPTQYWTSSNVLMVSLHSTEYPQMYCWYPSTVLNTLKCTDGIPLEHWMISLHMMVSLQNTKDLPNHWWYPPQHKTTSTVLYRRSEGCLSLIQTFIFKLCVSQPGSINHLPNKSNTVIKFSGYLKE